MKRSPIATATATALAAAAVMVVGSRVDISGDQDHHPDGAGIHWARQHQPLRQRSRRSPDLTYHGGPVMHGTHVEPIFWGTSWSNPTFVGDKVSGLTDSTAGFYSGIGGSSYANTTTEYTDSTASVGTAVALGPYHTDTSTVTATGQTTSAILAEVCREITSPVSNGYYPVYVDRKRGKAGFCAWHSAGTCNGVSVQFAFFFNLDGDSGCDPQDNSGAHSQGLAALANVSGHELSETLTDRQLNAWYDSSGSENADKCAWTFGTPLLTFSNNSEWKVQGNWSNAHYDASTGYPNSGGQLGCIDGGNFK